MLWVKWLWGQVRRDGTGAPWDHTTPKCPICSLHHGTTIHKRLIHDMRWKVAFRDMWLSTWGLWRDTVTEWWKRASAADLHHVSCLRIPPSLWDHIPRTLRVELRERVAWHQYHALGYTGPRERTSRQDGRASQETSHRKAMRTWDRPSYHTMSWAVKYLDQCLCPTALGAQQVASAM